MADATWRRLLRNAGYLLGGRVARDGMGLVALALAARQLGPAVLGQLVLLQSYALIVNGLFNFQSWQAVVRHGAAHDLDTDHGRAATAGLLRFGLVFDTSTACAGAVVGLLAAGPVGVALLGWDAQTVYLARLYCVVVLLDLTGTWTAALRLFDRFDLLAIQGLVAAAVKLGGVLWALGHGWELKGFVGVWIAADLAGMLTSALLALTVAARIGVLGAPKAPLRQVAARYPGIVSFLLTTNWHATVRMVSKEADVLVVGGLLGPAGAGLFKIVKQVASLLSRATDPLYQAVYPELARLWSAGEHVQFRRLLNRSTVLAALVASGALVIFALWGKSAMALVLQPEYAEAHRAALIYLAASGLAMGSFAFHPAALAMDRPAESFAVLLTCTVLHFSALLPLIGLWGLEGASAAYVLFYLAWVGALRWRLAIHMNEATGEG